MTRPDKERTYAMPKEVPLSKGKSGPEETAWRRWRVAELSAQGLGRNAIAKAVSCSPQTVSELLQSVKVQNMVRTMRAEIMSQIAGQITEAAQKAIAALVDVIETSEKPYEKAKAADSILTHFRALTSDNLSSLSTTPELVFAALPLIVQTVGPQAVMDAVVVHQENTRTSYVPQILDVGSDT